MRRHALAVMLAALGMAEFAGTTAAQTSPDTLGSYLRAMADSTSDFFGPVAGPADTTGIDSVRAYALANPWRDERAKLPMSFYPDLTFNRVDGPVYGAIASVGRADRAWGKVRGDIAYASGPNLMLGGGRYARDERFGWGLWKLRIEGGRHTEVMDRERSDRRLSALWAFVNGNDHKHYLRRDGFSTGLGLETETVQLQATYRDELESPRVTTATWNLLDKQPDIVDNLPAAFGRAREIELFGQWRLPMTPIIAQVDHATSSRRLNSDFEYRRTLFAAGADVGLGRSFSLVPQIAYGRLAGDFIPQEAHYLGGSHSLRSIVSESLGGSRMALARLELYCVRDILALMHLPHPAAFPLEASVFGAAGAVWGPDPYGGATRPGQSLPDFREDWKREVGVSAIYRPGIPDPLNMVRFSFAQPVGPGGGNYRINFSICGALDLVRPFGK